MLHGWYTPAGQGLGRNGPGGFGRRSGLVYSQSSSRGQLHPAGLGQRGGGGGSGGGSTPVPAPASLTIATAAPPANTTAVPAVGMAVAKSGRTTGLSCGSVLAVDGELVIDYPAVCGNPSDQQILFTAQVVIGDIAHPGDSGSLIVDAPTSRPLALVSGISSDGRYTTANPASQILAALGTATGLQFSFVGGPEHLVSCSAPSSAVGARLQGKDEAEAIQIPIEEILRAVAVKERHRDELLNDPAVLGIAVGRSEARRQSAAIIVFVEKDKNLSSALRSFWRESRCA